MSCEVERKVKSREQKEAEKERQFALRQEKKKEKHRGAERNLADLIFVAIYTLEQSYPKGIFKQNCQAAFHHHAAS